MKTNRPKLKRGTQRLLSKLSGVQESFLSDIINGRSYPSLLTVKKLIKSTAPFTTFTHWAFATENNRPLKRALKKWYKKQTDKRTVSDPPGE